MKNIRLFRTVCAFPSIIFRIDIEIKPVFRRSVTIIMLDQEIIDDLKIFIKKIMKDEGIAEYDIHIEGQTEKGTNYAGEIVFFSVQPRTVEKKYNFVMKTSKRSKKVREIMKDGALDRREMYFYAKVVPELRQLLEEYNSGYHLQNIARTYSVNIEYGHETMIMDDLRKQGCRLWNKTKPMNLEHIKTVVSSYGKYHASTVALHLKKPEVFNDLAKEMTNVYRYFLDDESVKKLYKDYMEDALGILNEAGLKEIVEELKEMPENALNILVKDLRTEDKVIITHGDCWINNMMFKYEGAESHQPLDVYFLDFQLSSFASPAIDLSYYLYTSCDEETITDRFDELLKMYYESFSSTLKDFDIDAQEVFSFSKLKEHWKRYAVVGLIMASFVIKIQLTNKAEAPPDMTESEDLSALKLGDIEDNDVFKSRIIAVFTHYFKTCCGDSD